MAKKAPQSTSASTSSWMDVSVGTAGTKPYRPIILRLIGLIVEQRPAYGPNAIREAIRNLAQAATSVQSGVANAIGVNVDELVGAVSAFLRDADADAKWARNFINNCRRSPAILRRQTK